MGALESDYTQTTVNNTDYKEYFQLSNFPNPFNSKTNINFILDEPGHVYLSVYNITGQKIVDLLNGNFPAGKYFSYWDGKDDSGNKLASGVYIIRLNVGNHSLSKPVIFMK